MALTFWKVAFEKFHPRGNHSSFHHEEKGASANHEPGIIDPWEKKKGGMADETSEDDVRAEAIGALVDECTPIRGEE